VTPTEGTLPPAFGHALLSLQAGDFLRGGMKWLFFKGASVSGLLPRAWSAGLAPACVL
jgi:hypothetical protein